MRTIATLSLLVLLWCGLAPAARACPVPTNVQATSPTATALTVSFTPAAGVSQYMVWLSTGNRRTGMQSSGGAAVTFSGLQPATSYLVQVASICSPIDTTLASPITATTTGGGACAPVTNTTLGPVTANQATLNFTPVSGALSYTIYYWATSDSTAVQTLTVTGSPATLTNLLPNTRYAVRIATNCANGSISSTPATVFQTAGTAAVCGPVTNVVVTAASDSTATVSFTPGPGSSNFQVIYFSRPDSTVHTMSGTGSPITIAGLSPGHTYYIRVLSQCAGGSATVFSTGNVVYGFRGAGALAVGSTLGADVLEAFPNPARQAVTVRLPAVPGASTARLTLLNSLGQTVRSQEVALPAGGAQAELGLSGVTPGLYTLRVAVGSQAATRRLAVE